MKFRPTINIKPSDKETVNHKEQILKLRYELLAVETERNTGCTLDELEQYLDDVINDTWLIK